MVKEQSTASHSLESTVSQQPASHCKPPQDHLPSTSVTTTACSAKNSEEGVKGQYLLSERGVNKLSLNLNLVCSMIITQALFCDFSSLQSGSDDLFEVISIRSSILILV